MLSAAENDDFSTDENSIEQLLDDLREKIQFDGNIATKSAMLLKLLEVSLKQMKHQM